MNELLDVRGLGVTYPLARRRSLQAVNEVSFTLARARTLGIVGESGCGKSSLARAILQLQEYSGQVYLQGTELGRLSGRDLRRMRGQMQAVFQDPLSSLNPRMTVAAILDEPLRLHCPQLDARARQQKVSATLKRVGLKECLARFPHELSGGQCQRVGIARAIIAEPALLVCDEPVSALDASVRGQVLGLLESLRQELGISIIFIAHDMTAVRYLCDDVLVMYGGRVVEQASRQALFDSPAHPYTRELLAAVLPPDPTAQPPEDRRPAAETGATVSAGCRYAPRCAFREPPCERKVPALRNFNGREVACHRAEDVAREAEPPLPHHARN